MRYRAVWWLLIMVLIPVLISGCAGPQKKKEETVFYPDPPELPRIQFLVSFSGAKDIEPEKSAFDVFVTGEKESRVRLDKPYGVAIHDGKIYVCDTNGTVMVFDFKKNTFGPLEGAKNPAGRLIQPINISVDGEGNKYVADPVRGQVVVFDRNDLFVKTLGTPGTWKPLDAVEFEGKIYVADGRNGQILVFDKATGEKIKTLGKRGEPDDQTFLPTNLAFDRKGNLYAADALKFKILKFDRDGHFLEAIGSVGIGPGHFSRPRGIAFDRENRLYVVDASVNNVQVFDEARRLLLFFSYMGQGPGNLVLPAKITIDYANMKYFEKYVSPDFEPQFLILVTSQFGDRLVNVYAYGKKKGVRYPTDEEVVEQWQKKLEELRKAGTTGEEKKEK